MVTPSEMEHQERRFADVPAVVCSRIGQIVGVIAAWLFVVLRHWENDGLWYLGDSSTHAINGAFWWDFITHVPDNPLAFALSYYSRYPIISPVAYPPVFYILEGALYKVFGVSPRVPRMLILLSALLGALYLCAWLRRWVSPASGWLGATLVLQPAFVVWSNAIMLNIPSAAMAIAALYHLRRWLDEPDSRHVWGAGAFGILSVLIYTPCAVIFPLMLGLALVKRKFRLLFNRRALVMAAIAASILVPWAIFVMKWAPGSRRVALLMGGRPYWELASWFYYPQVFLNMVSVPVLVLIALSLIVAWLRPAWRSEVVLGITLFVICYVWFSLIAVKEQRYALLLVPLGIMLASVAAVAAFRMLRSFSAAAAIVTAAITILIHFPLAAAVKVERISGFPELVASINRINPKGWIFYSGDYGGNYGYYLRASDPKFSRGMVRSGKLLYVTMIEPRFGMQQNVNSPADVTQMLRTQCGCQYLAVERTPHNDVLAERYLREALLTPDFRFVQSFRVKTPTTTVVDLYELLNAGERPHEVELAFPLLGEGVKYKIKPIEP